MTSTSPNPETHGAESRDRAWLAFFKVVNISNLASVVALVTSLYTLLFLIRPNLKPPEKLGATIAEIKLHHDVTLQQYRNATDLGSASEDRPPATKGLVAYIEIDLQGFQEREYGTFFLVLDAKTLKWAEYSGTKLISKSHRFSPGATADRGVIRAWVAYPDRPKEVILRVLLFDEGPKEKNPHHRTEAPTTGLLDVMDTKPFKVSG